MTSRADFDDDDWIVAAAAPMIAGAVVSVADDVGKGRTSEEEELAAFFDSFHKMAKKYSESDVVLEVMKTLNNRHQLDRKDQDEVFDFNLSQIDKPKELMQRVADAVDLAERPAGRDDVTAYKGFIYDTAEVVTNASKDSMTPLAERISSSEAFHLRQLRNILK